LSRLPLALVGLSRYSKAMARSLELRCKACGRVTLARAEPVYEGFKKVGEAFVCTGCGHRYPTAEETPFTDAASRPKVFSNADKPAAVKVFAANERRRTCGWCKHFIVNPFQQRCGATNREVEATDVCARFAAKPEKTEEESTDATRSAEDRLDALFSKPVREKKPARKRSE